MMTHRNFVIAVWLAVNLSLLIVFAPARTAVSPTPTSPSLPAPPPTLEAGNVQTPTDYGYNVSGLDRGPGPGRRVRRTDAHRSATLGRAVGKDTTPTASRAVDNAEG